MSNRTEALELRGRLDQAEAEIARLVALVDELVAVAAAASAYVRTSMEVAQPGATATTLTTLMLAGAALIESLAAAGDPAAIALFAGGNHVRGT